MGLILFTFHALERCERRNLDPQKLMESVRTIPPTRTPLEWTFPNGSTVVIQDKEQTRYILTVFWKKKKRKRVQY